MRHLGFLVILIILLSTFSETAHSQEHYVTAKPQKGDGIYSLLKRYKLNPDNININHFMDLNKKVLGKSRELHLSTEYLLPVKIYQYNSRSIRSTIGTEDFDYALSIQRYNESLFDSGLKPGNYRQDKVLWVPMNNFESESGSDKRKSRKKSECYPIFGKNYSKVEITDSKLKGHCFYLVSGHGGYDPGAIGKFGDHMLCEDEYAYDVILRLGRELIKHGAKVYFIVEDENDGIREEKFLLCDIDEKYYGNDTISYDQLQRLKQRSEIINTLYRKNKSKYKHQQSVIIHVDSRIDVQKKIDIFFYHNEGSNIGKKLSDNICETIRQKYELHQPGRGYNGFVSARNLYVLRKTIPPAVFIELGNIRNRPNQIRLIESSNRQAMAEWICEGIIKSN